ncbi:hypothetical protein GQ53DRAFT_639833 [Thozetella sp. PMI_491]|nr:hypothetical protein GQ53DRAFT_639833 [Thozetella sp. PMI_491]
MATAFGVGATPLSADTATAVESAPPVETEVQLPPQHGDNAAWPVLQIPKNGFDITNTTLADELLAWNDQQNLTKRSGSCSQGDCPDMNAAFDLLDQFTVIEQPGDPPIPLFTETWSGRFNDCNQCGRIRTSGDGCFDFTSCGRPQNICIDRNNNRAHRIWKDVGHRTCYSIVWGIWGSCGFVQTTMIWWPSGEVPCTW